MKLDAYQQYKILHQPNPPSKLKEITKYYSNLDVAATGQKIVEDITLKTVKNILKKTKSKYLICSGGFFQNVSFNNRLLNLGLKEIYIPSAPNDAGLSLGAALFVKMKLFNEKRPKKKLSPYLGRLLTKEIEKLINDYNLKYKDQVFMERLCKIINKR